jgi:hypothetical protein
MFKNKSIVKNYKWIMSILIIIGLCLIMISNLDIAGHKSSYTAGLGVGLIFAAVLNLVIIRIKQRNSDFEGEVEVQMQDERVKLNKMKSLAYAGIVMIATLVICNMLSAYMDFDLRVGNIIVLFSYSISLAGFKWFYRNR